MYTFAGYRLWHEAQPYPSGDDDAARLAEPALATYAVKDALSSIAKQSVVERSEVVNNRTSMDTMYDTANTLDTGFLIALQSGSLTADHVMRLTDDESAIIKEHQNVAAELVQMNVKLIDGSLPDMDIITLMRSSTIGAFDGGNVVIFYDVKASGEDADQPATLKAQLRTTHLDRSIKLALHSRTPDNLHIRDSDFVVLMDAGRGHDRDTLIGSLKDDTGKAMPTFPFVNHRHPLPAVLIRGRAHPKCITI
jgi:hypothetical protein